ncbi:unnamed protein product [Pleuronectes platessa]|uniref:Uncharacterized protein n=1 Tax=Pleuronectes platessa TaxID=8262 RepID=A0A9N7VIF9_PLEPL|nr:unnamed protein product [Pleuronectes platessa]
MLQLTQTTVQSQTESSLKMGSQNEPASVREGLRTLTQSFNSYLELCEIPHCFNCSTTIPHSPGGHSNAGLHDDRPVALTSVAMKSFRRQTRANSTKQADINGGKRINGAPPATHQDLFWS